MVKREGPLVFVNLELGVYVLYRVYHLPFSLSRTRLCGGADDRLKSVVIFARFGVSCTSRSPRSAFSVLTDTQDSGLGQYFEGRMDMDVSYPVEQLPLRSADVPCNEYPAASLEPLGDHHVRLLPRLTVTILTSIQGDCCTTRTIVFARARYKRGRIQYGSRSLYITVNPVSRHRSSKPETYLPSDTKAWESKLFKSRLVHLSSTTSTTGMENAFDPNRILVRHPSFLDQLQASVHRLLAQAPDQ